MAHHDMAADFFKASRTVSQQVTSGGWGSQSYNLEDLNSANKQWVWKKNPSPSWDSSPGQHFDSLQWDPEQRTQLSHAPTITYRNWETINYVVLSHSAYGSPLHSNRKLTQILVPVSEMCYNKHLKCRSSFRTGQEEEAGGILQARIQKA